MAKRVDACQPEIVRALRDRGVKVVDTHKAAGGFADLIARHVQTHALVWIEVKSARGKLTPAEQERLDEGWPLVVVRSVAEALAAVGVEEG